MSERPSGLFGPSSTPTLALVLFLLLLLVLEATAIVRAGGSGSGGTGGSTSGSGSSGSSASTSKYSILRGSSTGDVYTGSRAYRGYPITGVSYVAFYGSGTHYVHGSSRYNDSSAENCTLCPGRSTYSYPPPPPASSSTLQVTYDGEVFLRSLPASFSNFDDWNDTVYENSNGTCWVQNCSLTNFGSGTSSATCHRPWALAALGLLLMLGSLLITELAG